jgi:hypothetical protein
VAVNLSPPIDPFAEHRVFTGRVAAAAVVPDADADVPALPGIGWPTFQAAANAAALRLCSGVSGFAISFR